MVRAWASQEEPQLLLVLDAGPRGRFVYAARPHLLFTGGVQLQVLRVVAVAGVT